MKVKKTQYETQLILFICKLLHCTLLHCIQKGPYLNILFFMNVYYKVNYFNLYYKLLSPILYHIQLNNIFREHKEYLTVKSYHIWQCIHFRDFGKKLIPLMPFILGMRIGTFKYTLILIKSNVLKNYFLQNITYT